MTSPPGRGDSAHHSRYKFQEVNNRGESSWTGSCLYSPAESKGRWCMTPCTICGPRRRCPRVISRPRVISLCGMPAPAPTRAGFSLKEELETSCEPPTALGPSAYVPRTAEIRADVSPAPSSSAKRGAYDSVLLSAAQALARTDAVAAPHASPARRSPKPTDAVAATNTNKTPILRRASSTRAGP